MKLTMPMIRADEAARQTLLVLHSLFGEEGARRVGVRLWDGTRWPDDAPRPVTLALKHPGALRAAFLPGTELALAEAYLYDDFDIEGDIESVFDLADALAESTSGWRKKLRVARDLMRLPARENRRHSQRGPARLSGQRHSIERDRQAVTFHYDVSNDFYALWLDKRMVYSCAYFSSSDDDLDIAQERKLDYICRKLRLRAGQRLLDIGCGWGGLVMYAAQHYGVNATGITLSRPQAELANRRIAAAGLAGCARVEVRDVESLREHYALTLRHWVHRLEAQHDPALQYVDEPTYRAWRLFMSGSPHGFTTGRLNVYQALLVKPGEHGASGLPLTRRDWYQLQGNSRTT